MIDAEDLEGVASVSCVSPSSSSEVMRKFSSTTSSKDEVTCSSTRLFMASSASQCRPRCPQRLLCETLLASSAQLHSTSPHRHHCPLLTRLRDVPDVLSRSLRSPPLSVRVTKSWSRSTSWKCHLANLNAGCHQNITITSPKASSRVVCSIIPICTWPPTGLRRAVPKKSRRLFFNPSARTLGVCTACPSKDLESTASCCANELHSQPVLPKQLAAPCAFLACLGAAARAAPARPSREGSVRFRTAQAHGTCCGDHVHLVINNHHKLQHRARRSHLGLPEK